MALGGAVFGQRPGPLCPRGALLQASSAEATDDVERNLEELRRCLIQRGQAAAEAQELLITLAPRLEEVSAWMSDLDTVVERWKGRVA